MRIVIFGAGGMLGHQLVRRWQDKYEVYAVLHGNPDKGQGAGLFRPDRSICGIDVRSIDAVAACLDRVQPDAIVNAAGIVKQAALSSDCVYSLDVNAIFPQRLATLGATIGARVIHFSTDCVYSGTRGYYSEDIVADPEDLYGRSKWLGELNQPHCVTFRTSIVGRQLSQKLGLLEWFLSQRGTVKGFTRAIYSGFTTIEMTRIVEDVLTKHPQATGIWHVSSDPISKYDLLMLFKHHFRLDTKIVPDDTFVCDRSLDSSRFRSKFQYTPPTWQAMVSELAEDRGYYEE